MLWLPTALSAAAAIAGLVILAEHRAGSSAPSAGLHADMLPATPAPAPSVSPSPWKKMPPGPAPYALDLPEWRDLPQRHEARRHASGGRQDILVLGGPSHPAHVRIEIVRAVPEPPAASFYIDLARRAAEAGLAVERAGVPQPLATKFGVAEASGVVLSGAKSCSAFRFAHPELSFRLHGWLCGDGRYRDKRLACALDLLALAEPVDSSRDPALSVLFAKVAGRQGSACAPSRATAARTSA